MKMKLKTLRKNKQNIIIKTVGIIFLNQLKMLKKNQGS